MSDLVSICDKFSIKCKTSHGRRGEEKRELIHQTSVAINLLSTRKFKNSDPGGILTRGLQNRNLIFYTAKLRGHAIPFLIKRCKNIKFNLLTQPVFYKIGLFLSSFTITLTHHIHIYQSQLRQKLIFYRQFVR